MKIAVVIPAHNEAQTIGPLVEAVRALGYDCIVIDDGSVDKYRCCGRAGPRGGVKDRGQKR